MVLQHMVILALMQYDKFRVVCVFLAFVAGTRMKDCGFFENRFFNVGAVAMVRFTPNVGSALPCGEHFEKA